MRLITPLASAQLLLIIVIMNIETEVAEAQGNGENGAPLARVLPELITPVPPLRLRTRPSARHSVDQTIAPIDAATSIAPSLLSSSKRPPLSVNTDWAPSRELKSAGSHSNRDPLPLVASTAPLDGILSSDRSPVRPRREEVSARPRNSISNFVPFTTKISYRQSRGDNRRRIHAASTQPKVEDTKLLEELSQSSSARLSRSWPLVTNSNSSKVIVAPIKGRKVYTAITYHPPAIIHRGVSVERVDSESAAPLKGTVQPGKSQNGVEQDSSSSSEERAEIDERGMLGTPFTVTTKRQEGEGISRAEELVSTEEEIKRTTIGEQSQSSTTTTFFDFSTQSTPGSRAKSMDGSVNADATKKTHSKKELSELKFKAAELVKRIAMRWKEKQPDRREVDRPPEGNVQVVVSRDTHPAVSSSSAASNEIRFPAQPWQIPPELAKARLEDALPHGEIQRRRRLKHRPSYDEALDVYSQTQQPSSTALSIASRTTAWPGRGNSKALSIDARPLARPVQQPEPMRKLKAKFAKHHDSPPSTPPIPLPIAITDETDMDLLVPTTPAAGPYGYYPGAGIPKPAFNSAPTLLAGVNSPAVYPPQLPPGNSQQLQYLIPPAAPSPGVIIPAPGVLGLPPLPPVGPPASLSPSLPSRPAFSGGQMYAAHLNPNAKLDLCCRKQQVSSECQSMCNFDTFTDQSLISAVLSNRCPGKQLSQAFDCATSKVDHTDCCRRAGVHLHNNGQCMPFCATHVPTPPNLLSYVACLHVFKDIKNCYRDHQLDHPNIYGD